MSHLKTIGCLCYALNLKPRHDKFAAKGRRCIFLGYPAGQKAYRLYDLDNHTVFVSRDVYFEEEIFPFRQHDFPKQNYSPCILPPYLPLSPDSTKFLESEFSPPAQSSPQSTTPIISSPIPEQPPILTSATDHPPHTFALSPQEPSNNPSFTHHSPSVTNHSPSLRRTTRTVKPPSWLKDFACSASTSAPKSEHSTILYPPFQPSDLNHLHPEYVTSLCNVISLREPHTYAQASQDPRWIDAMEHEIAALETNDTWEITDLPPDKKAISSKWVYKIKFKSDGTVERFKARFVVRGLDQIPDEDYTDTFSPVAKSDNV